MDYLSSRDLQKRYQITSTTTLKNWGKREKDPLPEPAKLMGNRLYWRLSDIEGWEKIVQANPGRSPLSIIEANGNDSSMIGATELCKMMGIQRRTLGRWIANPELIFPKSRIIRNRHYWSRFDVDRWLASKKV